MLQVNGGGCVCREKGLGGAIHLDILKSNRSQRKDEDLITEVISLVKRRGYPEVIKSFQGTPLEGHLEKVVVDCSKVDKNGLSSSQFFPHYYYLNDDAMSTEELEDDGLPAASHWVLPSAEFEGLWENLIFDTDIKTRLMQYMSTALMYADHKVDPNIISWNKVVLLHGPPGTGKTSLCKALAQKLTIRHGHRFHYGQLIEISSHSLFSKWFSESGKLVTRMFQKIQELIDNPEALVIVLIDEVESLAHCRKASIGGSEPSDAIRVVNALLTQIDHIKRFPNVLVLTTSNITGTIDMALIDRADIRQYIGYPSHNAVARILKSCIEELVKTKILEDNLSVLEDTSDGKKVKQEFEAICSRCVGLSGRTLRKLPLIAQAVSAVEPCTTIEAFLCALSSAIDRQHEEREDVKIASR